MFWGKGDSSKLTREERNTLSELQRLVETGHIVGLDHRQTEIALAAIRFYGSVTATTGLLVGVRNVLLFIGSLLMIWWVSHDAIVEFIRNAVGTGS